MADILLNLIVSVAVILSVTGDASGRPDTDSKKWIFESMSHNETLVVEDGTVEGLTPEQWAILTVRLVFFGVSIVALLTACYLKRKKKIPFICSCCESDFRRSRYSSFFDGVLPKKKKGDTFYLVEVQHFDENETDIPAIRT